MPRLFAIDYGTKKTGLAVSDPLQIIATGLDTIPTDGLLDFIDQYIQKEEVETIVLGEPLYPDGNPAQIHHLVVGLKRKLEKLYPNIPVVFQDERYTSEEAKIIIRNSGVKKKKRRDKNLVDKVSAILILQDYMESI
ncbi:MAG: Holliday junction resolvase RuvX [Saprospiraceae bacterium]